MNSEATWRKSSYSSGSSGQSDCVEVARLTDGVGLRDSKSPSGGHISLGRDRFATLVTALKHR